MNANTDHQDLDELTDVTRIYPRQVYSSVSSNMKCMVHQLAQGPESPQLILSIEPGEYRLTYNDDLPFMFGMLRVLSGSLTIEGGSGRFALRQGETRELPADREMLVSSEQITQAQFFAPNVTEAGANGGDVPMDDHRYWIIARPRPSGPVPPRPNLAVDIVPGTDT